MRHSAVVQFNAVAAQAQPVLLEKLGPLVGPSGCGERPTLSQPRRAEQPGRGQSFVAVPHLNCLLRLSRRLEELRFPADDPLRVAAARAYDATWRLSQEAHHLAVRMGCR